MGIKLTEEKILGDLKESAKSAKQQTAIEAFEKDCTAFNDAKKEIFDHLSLIIEGLRGRSDCNVHDESEATLQAILTAKDRLDTLFTTTLRVYGSDY